MDSEDPRGFHLKYTDFSDNEKQIDKYVSIEEAEVLLGSAMEFVTKLNVMLAFLQMHAKTLNTSNKSHKI